MTVIEKQALSEKLMNKIRKGGLIIAAYLTLGYPDLETSIEAMIAVAKTGVDIIEIGLPFSDPIADGPTIQYSNEVSLKNGFTVNYLEHTLSKLRSETSVSIIVMTYGNILYQYPLTQFKEIFDKYEIDGVIVPDIPPEHDGLISKLSPIYLIAPNTSDERIEFLSSKSNNFVYVVSKLGITGGNYEADNRLRKLYEILEETNPTLPRLQGFGINSVESVNNAIQNGAHGVIIGSKLLKLLGDTGDIDSVTKFIQAILNHL